MWWLTGQDGSYLARVQVKRGKETAQEIDIYDFLLRGDITQILYQIAVTAGVLIVAF